MADIDTLVSGLVAHLDKVEAYASEAAGYTSSSWSSPTSAVVDTGAGGLQGLVVFPDSPSAHMVAMFDPDGVLGLVRATRDLIAHWEACRASRKVALQSGTPDGVAREQGRVRGAEVALQLVARGWGVVDNEGAD